MEHYKDFEIDRIHILERLVNELLKDQPREESVKVDMETLGLDYCVDPIERINLVLKAMHPPMDL